MNGIRLEDIGFYTLSDERALLASRFTSLKRCELVLTSSCNFSCPYCRPMREDCAGTMPFRTAVTIVEKWLSHRLHNIRFSGGEPTLYRDLDKLIAYARGLGVKRAAISTNGSADTKVYADLIRAGANDFSVSFDACCSGTADSMSGQTGMFRKICDNIEWLASRVYTTVGVVLTETNKQEAQDIIALADSLGVHDIRVIPAAQYGNTLSWYDVPQSVIKKYPILEYRLRRAWEGESIRGIRAKDTNRCPLVLDDMAVAGNYHFPCIIYFRERGNPIGTTNQSIEAIREERQRWFENTNTQLDPICKSNCLDVCVAYNNKWERFHNTHGVYPDYCSLPNAVHNLSAGSHKAKGGSCDARQDSCCNNTCDGQPDRSFKI